MATDAIVPTYFATWTIWKVTWVRWLASFVLEQPDLALFYTCKSWWEILHTLIHIIKISPQLNFLLFFNSTAYERGKVSCRGYWYKRRIATVGKFFPDWFVVEKQARKTTYKNIVYWRQMTMDGRRGGIWEGKLMSSCCEHLPIKLQFPRVFAVQMFASVCLRFLRLN